MDTENTIPSNPITAKEAKPASSVDEFRKNQILKARARMLSRRQNDEKHDEKYIRVVEFLLGNEAYAFDRSGIEEIYALSEVTQLPGTPPFVVGILNVRGKVVTLVDLKPLFDLPHSDLTVFNKVIIGRSNQVNIGFLADEVLSSRTLMTNSLQPAPSTISGFRADCLKGIGPDRLIVLDMEKLLNSEKIRVDLSV